MRTIGIRDALREALHEEMTRDDSVFVMGEDVIMHGGPYTVTEGISEKFPGRIFETPIAEAGIVGLGWEQRSPVCARWWRSCISTL